MPEDINLHFNNYVTRREAIYYLRPVDNKNKIKTYNIMSSADKSSSATIRKNREKTLANFHKLNPQTSESGNKTFSHTFLIARKIGQCSSDFCSCTLETNLNLTSSVWLSTNYEVGGLQYNGAYAVTWDTSPFATSYTLTSDIATDLVIPTGETSATVYLLSSGDYSTSRTFTLTVNTSCGTSTSSIASLLPCFLAGSVVHMSDKSTKPIEDVLVGDTLLGAFGEINTVLALHRPLLGKAKMCRINNDHSTTNHHPHISLDKRFYCGNPELLMGSTYGRTHIVIDADGNQVERMLHGLKKERVHPLRLGIELKTAEGSRVVNKLETYGLPEDTQLYNLVVSGSHTYHVDGYAVTGWPSEQDFDYDTWTATVTSL